MLYAMNLYVPYVEYTQSYHYFVISSFDAFFSKLFSRGKVAFLAKIKIKLHSKENKTED